MQLYYNEESNSKNDNNNTHSYFVYETPISKITISSNGEAITTVCFGECRMHSKFQPAELTDRTAVQINEYLAGKRVHFDIPIQPEGTPFQRLVWDALINIPYGKTASYKQIAMVIGNPNACRAVGMANNKNPIAIIIPCHRVIGSDGSLVGYASGLHIKQHLLAMEKGNINTPVI